MLPSCGACLQGVLCMQGLTDATGSARALLYLREGRRLHEQHDSAQRRRSAAGMRLAQRHGRLGRAGRLQLGEAGASAAEARGLQGTSGELGVRQSQAASIYDVAGEHVDR